VKPVIAALGRRGGGRGALMQGAGSEPAGAQPFVEAMFRLFSAS
jgi:hypothetical protein